MSQILELIKSCVQPISSQSISLDTRFQELEEWDSISTAMLFVEVSTTFGVELEPKELSSGLSVIELESLISQKADGRLSF